MLTTSDGGGRWRSQRLVVLLAAGALATLAYAGIQSNGAPNRIETFVSRLFVTRKMECRQSGLLVRQAVDMATRRVLAEGMAALNTKQCHRYISPRAIFALLRLS